LGSKYLSLFRIVSCKTIKIRLFCHYSADIERKTSLLILFCMRAVGFSSCRML
jgi:hypothetical protein